MVQIQYVKVSIIYTTVFDNNKYNMFNLYKDCMNECATCLDGTSCIKCADSNKYYDTNTG